MCTRDTRYSALIYFFGISCGKQGKHDCLQLHSASLTLPKSRSSLYTGARSATSNTKVPSFPIYKRKQTNETPIECVITSLTMPKNLSASDSVSKRNPIIMHGSNLFVLMRR